MNSNNMINRSLLGMIKVSTSALVLGSLILGSSMVVFASNTSNTPSNSNNTFSYTNYDSKTNSILLVTEKGQYTIKDVKHSPGTTHEKKDTKKKGKKARGGSSQGNGGGDGQVCRPGSPCSMGL